jgi:hypothetical protein
MSLSLLKGLIMFRDWILMTQSPTAAQQRLLI